MWKGSDHPVQTFSHFFLSKWRLSFYFLLIFIILDIFIPSRIKTAPSIIWNNPIPGHNPRFDPRKLRDSMKLNWSTVMLVTSISLTTAIHTSLSSIFSDWAPSNTSATVWEQGILQSEFKVPVKIESAKIKIKIEL